MFKIIIPLLYFSIVATAHAETPAQARARLKAKVAELQSANDDLKNQLTTMTAKYYLQVSKDDRMTTPEAVANCTYPEGGVDYCCLDNEWFIANTDCDANPDECTTVTDGTEADIAAWQKEQDALP